MAIDVLAYALEFFLGPIFLVLHVPELPAVVGDVSTIAEVAANGEIGLVFENFLAGEYDVAGKTLTSMLGTLLWMAIIAGTLGQFGELGEMGEVLEIFG